MKAGQCAAIESAARTAALATLQPLARNAGESICFERGSTVLVLGPAERAVAVGVELAAGFDVFVFAAGAQEPLPRPRRLHVIGQALAAMEGHLGRFRASVATAEGSKDVGGISRKADGSFDLVIDLDAHPLLARTVAPLGYFHAPDDATAHSAIEQLRALPATVAKPRYVGFDPALCTHDAAGVVGCTSCLSVCPAQAIASIGNRIGVDFNLCQGCATCTAACPTGALSYANVPRAATLVRLRRILDAYRAAGGRAACILVHNEGDARAAADPCWLPFAVPKPAVFGLEHMLAAFAWGAAEVTLIAGHATPGESAQTLTEQAGIANRLLALTEDGRVRVAIDDQGLPATRGLDPLVQRVAGELPTHDKRTLLFAALDHVLGENPPRPLHVPIALPRGAPLGAVEVDPHKCTLCLACVNLCPTHALLGAERDAVELGFVEQRCVQCGVCERGCPEQAIGLRPRLVPDTEARRRPRLVASDPRATCVECGTRFMSRRQLEAALDKVKLLPQFAGDAARRLRMCPACRQRATLLDASGMH